MNRFKLAKQFSKLYNAKEEELREKLQSLYDKYEIEEEDCMLLMQLDYIIMRRSLGNKV